MSFRAVHWALHEVRGVSRAHKILLILLSEYADDEDVAWPSQDTLADVLECSVSTVRRTTRDLEVWGLLERAERWVMDDDGNPHRASNVYKLNVGALPSGRGAPAAPPRGSRRSSGRSGGPASGGGEATGRPIPVKMTGIEEAGTKVPVDNLSDERLSVGNSHTGQNDRYRSYTGQNRPPYRSPRVTGISIPNHQENHQTRPDQEGDPPDRDSGASGRVGSGREDADTGGGQASDVSPLPPSAGGRDPAPVRRGGSGDGAGGGREGGDAAQASSKPPRAAERGRDVSECGSGADRRSDRLLRPPGGCPPEPGAGLPEGAAGLLGACLPESMRALDSAGAREVAGLLRERIDGGWRPWEIRRVMDQRLPERPGRLAALVAYRLRANVDPGAPPRALEAAAGRGRVEAARRRAEAIAEPGPARPRDPLFERALSRAREQLPGATRLEQARRAAELIEEWRSRGEAARSG